VPCKFLRKVDSHHSIGEEFCADDPVRDGNSAFGQRSADATVPVAQLDRARAPTIAPLFLRVEWCGFLLCVVACVTCWCRLFPKKLEDIKRRSDSGSIHRHDQYGRPRSPTSRSR